MKIAEVLECDIKELIDLEPILFNPAYEDNLPFFFKREYYFYKR